jgi:chemotaxis protein histidine kinase CheA
MTVTPPDRGRDAARDPRRAAGLRLRLWLACLAGPLVAAAGVWWVIGARTGPVPALDLPAVVSWLGAVVGLALVVGAAFALWLDRVIVVQARGLSDALALRRLHALRGLPGTSGWGELSELTLQIQELMTRYRHAELAADELGMLRDQLDLVHDALGRWAETERWKELPAIGSLAPLIETLNRGLRRREEIAEQNREAAQQIAAELQQGLEAARETAEQAEGAFVEATALLTTVRELHRLGQDLAASLAGSPLPSERGEPDVAAALRDAIEELIAGSARTVELLARGMEKVEEITDQVPRIANRATLIALHASIPGRAASEAEAAAEARRLALDIQAAVERALALKRDLHTELAEAAGRMREVRERVAGRLEALGPASLSAGTSQEALRLLERVREMVQDATRKGERLSATGERASRSAEAMLRALEAETREMAGLLARLAPAGEAPAPGTRAPDAGASPGSRGLRLLGQEDLLREGRDPGWPAPGSAEEPR